jgi:MOSC domain-containing protein YiiM
VLTCASSSPGDIGVGDAIQVVWRPEHDVTIRLAFEAWLVDRSLIPRLRSALPHLSPAWQRWIDTDPDRPVRFE